MPLADGEDTPVLSLPATVGVGWGGFYERGTGHALYGRLGLAYSHPFEAGGAKWRVRAEALAVYRDGTLRTLGMRGAERAGVVPLVTVGVSVGY